jgi:hypothetical protein
MNLARPASFALVIVVLDLRNFEANAQPPLKAKNSAAVEAEQLGVLDCIRDGEHRLGGTDRMFLVEDQWEWDRCARLIVGLPKVDLQTESLLVVMSWPRRPRTFEGVNSEGEQLIINVREPAQEGWESGHYLPPKFIVVRVPRWTGPVQFRLNDFERFTLLRGEAHEKKIHEIWEEILRLHSGGRPTADQYVRTFQYRRAEPLTEDQIRQGKAKYFVEMKAGRVTSGRVYPVLFRDLIDLRAHQLAPRIFHFLEAMGQHDPTFDFVVRTLTALGGDDVVARCSQALNSPNARSRHAAMIVLANFVLPETRRLAHAHLADFDLTMARVAMNLLTRLGSKSEDVPVLIRSLNKLETKIFSEDRNPLGHPGAGLEEIEGFIYVLKSLGPDAREALPTLKRVAADRRYPGFSRAPELAREAVAQIEGQVTPLP